MFKNLLLAGALLVPVLAYGGSPGTDLSLQIVPAASMTPPPPSPTPPTPPPPSPSPPPTSSACGAAPVGAAASDVAAAGFSTCAIYYDWTYGIPNTVGTGLPSNWIDCGQNGGDTPNANWTWGMNWFTQGHASSCAAGGNSSNSTVFEDTDSDGNLALHISYPLSEKQCCGQYGWVLTNGPYTVNLPNDDANLGKPAPWNFPFGVYIEYTYKDSGTDISGYPNEVGFWTFNASAYGSGNCAFVEMDFNETIATPGTATDGWHDWNCSGSSGTNFTYYFPLTSYTTYGYLVTNDGNNNVSSCAYINGTRQNCETFQTTDTQGTIYGRMPLWFDGYWNNPPYNGPEDTWIKYVKVYSCSNWLAQGNPAAAACSGTTYNGNFYVPSSQLPARVIRPTSPRHH